MLSLLIAVFVVLVTIYVCYSFLCKPYQHLKALNVPGPKPIPILGNLNLLWKTSGKMKPMLSQMKEKYGPISGFYLGPVPALCVSDVDFLKEMMIKQFDNYVNRFGDDMLPINVDGKMVTTLDFASGENWRKRRHKLSPAFSSLKMKLMEPLIRDSTDRLKAICQELADSGKSADAQIMFSKLTMEVVLSVAFGQSLDVQNDKGGDLYQLALKVMSVFDSDASTTTNMAQFILFGYPQLGRLMDKLLHFTGAMKPLNDLVEVCKKVVNNRMALADQVQRKDLLQLMIEAGKEDGSGSLTFEEIVADCLVVMIAGYATSSNSLAFATYLLAVHQDVQERLADAINDYFEENPDSSIYDASQNIEYLDMVIYESMRLYPPAVFTTRICGNDCVTNGVSVKKGTYIFIPICDVQCDPELWEDPDQFNPERFSKENKSAHHIGAFQTFGIGPRNCIGMRFALLEIKMAIIEIVRHFRIITTPDTKIPLEIQANFIQSPGVGQAMIRFERK